MPSVLTPTTSLQERAKAASRPVQDERHRRVLWRGEQPQLCHSGSPSRRRDGIYRYRCCRRRRVISDRRDYAAERNRSKQLRRACGGHVRQAASGEASISTLTCFTVQRLHCLPPRREPCPGSGRNIRDTHAEPHPLHPRAPCRRQRSAALVQAAQPAVRSVQLQRDVRDRGDRDSPRRLRCSPRVCHAQGRVAEEQVGCCLEG